jgi:hypothetical protein
LIANQIAAVCEPIRGGLKSIRKGLSNEGLLPEVDLRRLTRIEDNERRLIFVCQPGKDELDERILQAIGAG